MNCFIVLLYYNLKENKTLMFLNGKRMGSWACGPGRRRATKRRILNKTTVSAPHFAAFLLKRVTLRHGVTHIHFGVHHSSSSIFQSG